VVSDEMVQSNISMKKAIQDCATCWKNHGYRLLGWERCHS